MNYSYLKLLHLIAVMVFLGSIITGLFWMNIAVKTKDLKIIRFTIKGILRADNIFTGPGVLVIIVAGVLSAIHGQLPILGTGWIFWSIVVFSISGLVFAFKVLPLQRKINALVHAEENQEEFDWIRFNETYKAWNLWGLIATATPMAAFVMMTLKIPV